MTKDIVLFGIFSLVHLIAIFALTRESFLYLPSKIIPILILIVYLAMERSSLQKRGKLVLVGLVFSLFGDSFLALPGPDYFVPGLGSFLIAQLIYAYAFSLGTTLAPIRSLPFVIFGIVFFYLLSPHLGPLLLPVGIYISAICLMGWRSSARASVQPVYVLGLWGAIIFMISDSVIAYSMFLNPSMDRQIAGLLIMLTYYIAQLLIYLATKEEELAVSSRKST